MGDVSAEGGGTQRGDDLGEGLPPLPPELPLPPQPLPLPRICATPRSLSASSFLCLCSRWMLRSIVPCMMKRVMYKVPGTAEGPAPAPGPGPGPVPLPVDLQKVLALLLPP
jgi:hypothetical protein